MGAFEVSDAGAGALTLHLLGDWTVHQRPPSAGQVMKALAACATAPARLVFDTSGLRRWDSALVTVLRSVSEGAAALQIEIDPTGLPSGARRLLRLAATVPERGDRGPVVHKPWLARIGDASLAFGREASDAVGFIGGVTQGMLRLLTGRSRLRGADLLLLVQQTGAQALPIVALISILVGLILAFVGAVQLRLFGAEVYVANLVAIGMTREMGAMMAAIIMAGRTGAAFAAQLGTMQVNEEIDALRTLGVDPIDFLVMPRILALVLMMPLLCVYADVLGILGGFVVGVGMLDIGPGLYWHQTLAWIRVNHVLLGIGKSVVFGVIIAFAGCLRGIQCGRSAAAVGAAATSSVVTAIVWIVVADGLFAVLSAVLGI